MTISARRGTPHPHRVGRPGSLVVLVVAAVLALLAGHPGPPPTKAPEPHPVTFGQAAAVAVSELAAAVIPTRVHAEATISADVAAWVPARPGRDDASALAEPSGPRRVQADAASLVATAAATDAWRAAAGSTPAPACAGAGSGVANSAMLSSTARIAPQAGVRLARLELRPRTIHAPIRPQVRPG